MKNDYNKNIKVNIYETSAIDSTVRRTSTTLNYQICDYYFGTLLDAKSANRALEKGLKTYRAWLVSRVQEWATAQNYANSNHLEFKLLEEIYGLGYRQGLDKNRDNLGLDI